MPEYLSPGVYVEEIPSGQAPIASVSTTIAGFIGQVLLEAPVKDKNGVVENKAIKDLMPEQPGAFEQDDNGNDKKDDKGNKIPKRFELAPLNEAQLITAWARFTEKFGGFQPHNKTLAHAVYGFFNNGGNRCWVVRVEDVTDPGTVTTGGLEKFEKIDEITMVLVPGSQDTNIQNAVIDHCRRMGDRFAILDGQQKPAQFTQENIQGGTKTSDYAALYFPWIKVYDPVTKKDDYIPPSGHIAGVYALTDIERGVHKAPANVVIRGPKEAQFRLSKADQDGLNPKGINVIRQFNGNVTVWGARTLGGDDNTEFKYINVRRLFLMLRESIDEGTQWVVFEPNAKPLWDKIRQNITAFLTNIWRSGALFGDTPEQAFFVKCDAELNPPEVRDLGQVITEIGVAPVKPAEFVIFRIHQWTGPGS